MRCSNFCLVFFNVVNLLLSFFTIIGTMFLPGCGGFLMKPMLAISALVMIASIVGIVGTCCKLPKVLLGHIVSLIILTILLFGFTMFVFTVTGKGSTWYEKKVNSAQAWKNIRTCLEKSQICPDFNKKFYNVTQQKFNTLSLFPIQAGCCKPSEKCGFKYIHPTEWNITGGDYKINPDCLEWSNKFNIWCLNCNSCKVGVVDQMRSFLRGSAMGNLLFMICLIIAWSLGLYQLKTMKEEDIIMQ